MDDKKLQQDHQITIIDPIDFIRSHPHMFLRKSIDVGADLAGLLLYEISVLTAGDVHITREDDWWIVKSEEDWIAKNWSDSVDSFFRRIVSFRQLGQNSFQTEVVLTAFSDDLVTASSDSVDIICQSGAANDKIDKYIGERGNFARILAFKLTYSLPAQSLTESEHTT